MAFPVTKVVMPADLAGQSNGRLPDRLLIAPGYPLRPKARMHRRAAVAFAALDLEVRRRFDEVLTVVSTNDAYRPYSVQEACFCSRYTTTPLAGRSTKTWNQRTYWQMPNTAMAGTPGTSNHGWGLARDTAIVRDGEVVGILANRAMFDWMLAHAADFGISWEAQSEPWHLRYNAGDHPPAAVAARAAATTTAPAIVPAKIVPTTTTTTTTTTHDDAAALVTGADPGVSRPRAANCSYQHGEALAGRAHPQPRHRRHTRQP